MFSSSSPGLTDICVEYVYAKVRLAQTGNRPMQHIHGVSYNNSGSALRPEHGVNTPTGADMIWMEPEM